MAGQSVQKVEYGLSGLSLGEKNSSTNGGDKKNRGIEVVDKSKDTHHTYKVFYYTDTIFTTVTHTETVLDEWLADLYKDYDVSKLNNRVVGLDIEWRRLRSVNSVTRNKGANEQAPLKHLAATPKPDHDIKTPSLKQAVPPPSLAFCDQLLPHLHHYSPEIRRTITLPISKHLKYNFSKPIIIAFYPSLLLRPKFKQLFLLQDNIHTEFWWFIVS